MINFVFLSADLTDIREMLLIDKIRKISVFDETGGMKLTDC